MKNKAFTLVEIMIVVAIIALLAAISIPNLLRARITSEEAAAASAMHTISAAMIQWRVNNPAYPDSIADLSAATPPYVDALLGSGTRQGYTFTAAAGNAPESEFLVTAVPVNSALAHSYYMNEEGVLCRSIAVNEPAAAYVPSGCPNNYIEVQ